MKDKLNIYVYTFKETLTTKNNQYKSYSSKAIGFKEKFFGIMMQKCHYIIHYTLQIYMLLYYYTVEKIRSTTHFSITTLTTRITTPGMKRLMRKDGILCFQK